MTEQKPEIWSAGSFSQPWLRDAYSESKLEGPDHRRHEVVFAVCLVETYLFEWVRDFVLKMDFAALETYFPEGRRSGIETKFKEVVKQLKADEKISATPNFATDVWGDFVKLVRMRDGLTHASVSRPERMSPSDPNPYPTALDFYALQAGWAVGIARRLLLATHEAARIEAPIWLVKPEMLLV